MILIVQIPIDRYATCVCLGVEWISALQFASLVEAWEGEDSFGEVVTLVYFAGGCWEGECE